MLHISIDISDRKSNFLMDLIHKLGFKKAKQTSEKQQQFAEDLQHSLEEVAQHQEGKIKIQSARDFLNAL